MHFYTLSEVGWSFQYLDKNRDWKEKNILTIKFNIIETK